MRLSRPAVVGAAIAALLAPAVPAVADQHGPTSSTLRAAHNRIAAAQRRVESLQVRAERAAEAYNGALVRAHRMQALGAVAARHAEVAQAAFRVALTAAQAAQAKAQAAAVQAAVAEAVRQQAQAVADAAQRKLDGIAASAYQTDGELGMVAQLIGAKDPTELALGKALMNHVGAYQDEVIAIAVAARDKARSAADAAEAAGAVATAAARQADAALAHATASRDAAESAHHLALAAANAAVGAAHDAASIRRQALALVAQAEAELGFAVRTAAQLEAEAAAARAGAGTFDDSTAPSDQARTAIHWAFKEIGTPYSWGGGDDSGPTYGFAQGANTKGFDCSGLTMFIYYKAGIQLDHYTGSQWNESKHVRSRADLLPGDLMFFAYDTSDANTIHHVAIYIGNGKMIEAPHTGSVVKVSSANRSDYIGATRPWA